MGKIDPYQLASISIELEQFRDDVTNIINLGKFSYATLDSGSPSWSANKGEAVFVMPASGGTSFWFYRNTAWVVGWSVTI